MWRFRIVEFKERALALRAAAGDREAGEQIVHRHYASVFGFMMALAHDREVAEELVQATFLCAWQSIGGFRGDSSLGTWLHQIAYRQYLKWRKQAPVQAPLNEETQGGGCLESDIVDALWLQEAIAALPESLAAPFVLHYVQQHPVGEVAQILEIKRGTVLSRLHTARQQMRRLLAGRELADAPVAPDSETHSNSERSCYEMSKAQI